MQPFLSPTSPQGQEFLLRLSPGLHLASLEETVRFPSSLSLLRVFVTRASIADNFSSFQLSSLLFIFYARIVQTITPDVCSPASTIPFFRVSFLLCKVANMVSSTLVYAPS